MTVWLGCRYCAGLPQAQELYERKLADRGFRALEASMPDLNKPTLNYIMRPFQVRSLGRCEWVELAHNWEFASGC